MKKRWILDGIDCANCAANVERALQQVPGVDKLNYHFPTKKLTVVFDGDAAAMQDRLQAVVDKTEPGAKLFDTKITAPSPEHKREAVMLTIALVLYLIAVVLRRVYGLGSLIPGLNPEHAAFDWSLQQIVTLVLFAATYIIAAHDVYLKAVKKIKIGDFLDENILMIIASLGAIAIAEYPEAVAVMLFYAWGEFFQDLAVERSRKSIEAAMDIRPETAELVVDGTTKTVDPSELEIGDIILLHPGDRVPIDGTVIEGQSAIDTMAITGESVPVDVAPGDEILSGCVNTSGLLRVRVEKAYDDSTVARMLELIEDASEHKAPTERLITRFARYYTPAVVFLAVALAIIPPLILGDPFRVWLYRSLIFLVASCPCALVISVPMAYFAGLGVASRSGILIKGGNTLEELADAKTIILDKTGTLTEGRFVIDEIVALDGYSETEVLEAAAIAEASSRHPIAEAIKDAGNVTVEMDELHAEDLTGFGIKADYQGSTYLVGNRRLMEEHGFDPAPRHAAATSAHVIKDGKYLGAIYLSDKIKDESVHAISDLKDCKRCAVDSVIMFTGDSSAVAEDVSRAVGLDRYKAELLPEDKLSEYELIEKEDGSRIFIGDGINDAPVLMASDIGIAMGAIGQDAAIEAADIIIGNDNLHKVHHVMHIARKTNRIVHQNIWFALGVKFIVLLLGALGYATMWAAVFADVGVALLAVLNSLRIMADKEFKPVDACATGACEIGGHDHDHAHAHGHEH